MANLKKLKFVIIFVLVVLSSVYLTFVIDTYTLNTWLKRVFIFCYFAAISCLALYLYSKNLKHKLTIIPLLCAFVAIVLGQNVFLPKEAEHTVYVQATENLNNEKAFKEVWLVDIEVDGQRKQLSKLQPNGIVNWTYSDNYDDYCFTPSGETENDRTNLLSFTVVGKEIKLIFGANTWSGDVRIFDDMGHNEIISLYNENDEIDRAEHTLNATRSYSVFERILYNAGALTVMYFTFKVLVGTAFHFAGKRKKTKVG
jgi:hypothetical protein